MMTCEEREMMIRDLDDAIAETGAEADAEVYNTDWWPFNCQKPNLIIDALVLDPQFRAEAKRDLPLHTGNKDDSGKRYAWLPGCYAWFNLGEDDGSDPYVVYVGKAANLRNRLVAHWRRSAFLREWQERESFSPYVAIWFSDERAALECQIMDALNPCANQRREN